MRRDQWIFMDNLKRKLYIKSEIKKKLLFSICKNKSIPLIYRHLSLFQKNRLIRHAALPQQVNRCFKSGRSWSVLKLTKYCRFEFRHESYRGNIPGFQRASW